VLTCIYNHSREEEPMKVSSGVKAGVETVTLHYNKIKWTY
jgi:hypothetical protein